MFINMCPISDGYGVMDTQIEIGMGVIVRNCYCTTTAKSTVNVQVSNLLHWFLSLGSH
jgi:hypothetical protein